MTAGRLARAAAIVALFGLVSRLLGFVREIVLAAAYGTSAVTDAFVNSLLIVNSVSAVLLYTLVTLIIPVFQRERAESGEGSAWRLVAAVAAWVGIGLIALASVAALWPEGPAALFRLDESRAEETARLLRIMAPALALQGFSALFTALLQIHGRFAGPAAVGVAFNLGIIAAVAAGQGSIGIEAAGWGVTLGACLQVLLQLPQLWRLLRRAGARPAMAHPRLRTVGAMAVPVLTASILQQVNNFTDKIFASTLEEGRVAALAFANALGQAPRVGLLLPLLTPLFPHVARLMSEDRRADAIDAFRRVAGLLALVSVPMAAIMAVYAHELAQLAFQRGACGTECVDEIGPPLTFYAFALWPAFLSLLLNRTLSAAARTREIMIVTTGTVLITIGLDFALIGPMEQAGLALAATLGVFANAVMLLTFMRRRFPELSVRALALRQGRILLSGGLAAAVALGLAALVPVEGRGSVELLPILLAQAGAALAVYLLAARALVPEELAEGVRAVRSLATRRRGRR